MKYNPTCIITGRMDNLNMYPIRNSKGEMVGWIFLHEDLKAGNITHKFDYYSNIPADTKI